MSYKEKQIFWSQNQSENCRSTDIQFYNRKKLYQKKKEDEQKKKNISHHRISTVLLNPHHPLRLRTEFNFRESMEFLFGFLTCNDAIHVSLYVKKPKRNSMRSLKFNSVLNLSGW